MTASALHKRAGRRTTADEAMAAWLAGDFERCVELCDLGRRRERAGLGAFTLLKARAELRLDLAAPALQTLEQGGFTADDGTAWLTARALTAAALVRFGEHERGVAMLAQAHAQARLREADPVVRSEIALHLGLAHYAKRDLAAAERAFAMVDARADVVHARALEYQGWIASARGENERAVARFSSALERLDTCRHYDRFVESECLRALSYLSVERLDVQTWDMVERRRARLDWSQPGLGHAAFWIAYCASAYWIDIEGDPFKAAREARLAERIAPTTPYKVQALCKRSIVAGLAGDGLSPYDHAENAAETFFGLPDREFVGDDNQKIIPLIMAEQFVNLGRVEESRAYMQRFVRSRPAAALEDPRTFAHRRFVEARILESSGELVAATKVYREAIGVYTRIGFKRRVVMATLRLATISGDPALYDYANAESSSLQTRCWIRRAIGTARERPIRLTPIQREIVQLICQGKSNREIALVRRRSQNTVRNQLSKIFEVFGVNSREEVAAHAIQHELYRLTPDQGQAG